MAVAITNDNFKTEIESYQGPIIVDIFASWCGPCQQMAPIFEELEKEIGKEYRSCTSMEKYLVKNIEVIK